MEQNVAERQAGAHTGLDMFLDVDITDKVDTDFHLLNFGLHMDQRQAQDGDDRQSHGESRKSNTPHIDRPLMTNMK